MSYAQQGGPNITQILTRVWPEYKCASQMRVGDPNDTEKYKSMYTNDKEQMVYLITNPASWPVKKVGGRIVTIRPEPEKLGKVSEWVDTGTATDRKSRAAGESEVKW